MTDEAMLSDRAEWTGHWWAPGEPKRPGILTYDPEDGVSLRLVGGWKAAITSKAAGGGINVHQGTKTWPVVLGEAEGKELTLLDVTVQSSRKWNVGLDGIFATPDRMTLRASSLLVGCHLASPDDNRFIATEVTVENLTVWAARTGLDLKDGGAKEDAEIGRIVARRVPDEDVKVAEGVSARLMMRTWWPFNDDTRWGNVARIREQAMVSFSASEPRPYSEMLHFGSSVGDLVSLSALRACSVLSLSLFLPATPEKYPEDYPLRDSLHRVALYHRRVTVPEPQRPARRHHEMLMTLADLPFSELLPKWFEAEGGSSVARSMILGLHYLTETYLESQVITAVAAAESLHRSYGPALGLSEEDHKDARTTALQHLKGEKKQYVADALMSNEMTLKARLTELARRPGEFMETLIPDAKKWAQDAGGARNTMAHVGPTGAQTSDDLYDIVQVTEAVVVLNLLHDLGVSSTRLAEIVDRHERIRFAAAIGQRRYASAE